MCTISGSEVLTSGETFFIGKITILRSENILKFQPPCVLGFVVDYSTLAMNYTTEERMKWHVEQLFGRDNIMFDTVASYNPKPNRIGYVYHNTCKLCGHVTAREQRTNLLYVCSGCYREWDKETNTILMPSNVKRIAFARKNSKLVLPGDTVEEPTEEPTEEPVEEPSEDIPVVETRTFTHVKIPVGQYFLFGDYIIEVVPE